MKRLALFLLLSSYICANAQTDTTKVLNEVIVTAYRSNRTLQLVPAAIGIVETKDLTRFSNTSFLPAMNTIPGVRMEERSPGSYRLSIRGSLLRSPFGIRNVKFYWNGLPMTDGGGNTYFNLLDVQSISRMEIIKGPGTSLYGAGTGGVVLLKSGQPSGLPYFNYSAVGGSFGLFKVQANGTILSNEKSTLMMGSSFQRSDGYRDHTEMKRFSTHLDWNYQINQSNSLFATLFTTHLFYETPGGLTKSQFEDDPTQARPATLTLPSAVQQKASVKNNTTYGGVKYEHEWSNHWSTNFGVFTSVTGFENPTIRNYEKRNEVNVGGRTETQGNLQVDEVKCRITAGGEFQYFVSPIDVFENNRGKAGNLQVSDKVWSQGGLVFAQADVELPNQIVATLGVSANFLRYKIMRTSVNPQVTQVRTFDTEFFPRLALLKKLGNSFSLFGSVSSGFSPPSIAEVRPSTNTFNKNINPESGINLEAGTRGQIGKQFNFDVVVFNFNLNNAIVIQRTSDGAEYFINSGDTKQFGVESAVSWNTSSINQNYHYKIWASYTLNRFYFNHYIQDGNNYSNNFLTGVSPNVVIIGSDLTLKKGFYCNATFTYTDRIALNDANSEFANEYFLLDTRLGVKKSVKKLEYDFFLGINNALNQQYSLGNDLNAAGGRYYNAAPVRNYFFGITIAL